MATPKKPRGPHQTLIQRSRSVDPTDKAEFHQVLGAGRSRVKREFLGLTQADEDAKPSLENPPK